MLNFKGREKQMEEYYVRHFRVEMSQMQYTCPIIYSTTDLKTENNKLLLKEKIIIQNLEKFVNKTCYSYLVFFFFKNLHWLYKNK